MAPFSCLGSLPVRGRPSRQGIPEPRSPVARSPLIAAARLAGRTQRPRGGRAGRRSAGAPVDVPPSVRCRASAGPAPRGTDGAGRTARSPPFASGASGLLGPTAGPIMSCEEAVHGAGPKARQSFRRWTVRRRLWLLRNPPDAIGKSLIFSSGKSLQPVARRAAARRAGLGVARFRQPAVRGDEMPGRAGVMAAAAEPCVRATRHLL
jgi:hypothetical protein